MNLRILAVLAAVTILCACQSKKAGMEVLCNAPVEVQKEAGWGNMPAADKAFLVAEWIVDHVDNAEILDFFGSISYADPPEKVQILRRTAAEHGLDDCPLADFIDELDKQTYPETPAGVPATSVR